MIFVAELWLRSLAPLHQPHNIAPIESIMKELLGEAQRLAKGESKVLDDLLSELDSSGIGPEEPPF